VRNVLFPVLYTIPSSLHIYSYSISFCPDRYLHVGPEIGVASTKAFTGQVTVLCMLAVLLAHKKGKLSDEELKSRVNECVTVCVHLCVLCVCERRTMTHRDFSLAKLPELVAKTMVHNKEIEDMSRFFRLAHNFLYLGRGPCFPVRRARGVG
jgi:glutamine---fructose-6-phosphate transaminase (isomerizing)